jgi:hypothetical protein
MGIILDFIGIILDFMGIILDFMGIIFVEGEVVSGDCHQED